MWLFVLARSRAHTGAGFSIKPMKIPKEIKGRNKIRDAAICQDWEKFIEDKEYPTKEAIKSAISLKYSLSELRIWQIVTGNYAYIPTDKALEKKKRIWELKLDIKNAGQSKKDKSDLLEQLRVEIEGEKPLIDQSVHNLTQIYVPEPIPREKVEAASRPATNSF